MKTVHMVMIWILVLGILGSVVVSFVDSHEDEQKVNLGKIEVTTDVYNSLLTLPQGSYRICELKSGECQYITHIR